MSWQNSPMGAPQQPMTAPQQPMAAAQQVAYEPHPFIGGRASALRALAAWRAAAPGVPRVALLTGSPGCGSSRLLTGFLMLCDPGHRERIDLSRLDPWTVPPPLPAPAVPSAAGLTPAQLLWVLADHYGIDVARDAEVYEALGAGERVIVVPDVDEAGPVRAGRGPERMARELLLPLAGLPSVRLLAEVPRAVAAEIAAALPAGTAQVIDLDAPEHADLHGLTLQTQIALDPSFGAPRLPFTEDPQMRLWLAQGIASRTATGPGGSRLTAQLAVNAHLLAPEPPPNAALFPAGPADAVAMHAQRLGADPTLLPAMLAPLALAEGEGLPLPLWAPLASALAARDLAPDIANGMPLAGPFVTTVNDEDAAEPTLITLAHPALGEAIRATLPDVRAAHLCLAMELLERVPAEGWEQADPYVRDGIVGHLLGAGQLPRLLKDPWLLVHTDPVVLRAALDEITTDARARESLPTPGRTYLRIAPLLTRTQAGPEQRARMLAAAFEEDGLAQYAAALGSTGRGAVDGPAASDPTAPVVPQRTAPPSTTSAPPTTPAPSATSPQRTPTVVDYPLAPPEPMASPATPPQPHQSAPAPTPTGPPPGRPATGPGNTAVFTYVDPRTGQEAYVTATSAPGKPPAEYQGMAQLGELRVPVENVVAIHTDLCPGYFPGGYTANVLLSTFPNASHSHAHPYGRDQASRTEGITALTSHAQLMSQLAGQQAPPQPSRAPLPHPVPPTHVLPDAELGPLLTQVFGEQKVRRYAPQLLATAALPDAARATLATAGLPADVPLFFLADTDAPGVPPVMGGMFADACTHLIGTGVQLSPDSATTLATHTRIGTDGMFVITVQRDSGQVWAAMPLDGSLQYVNSSVAAFAYSLATLYATRGHMIDASPHTAGNIVADLQTRLLTIDPNALSQPDNWWSLVIEQMWHGLF
ncbi:SUKH-4 family immunity protein [Streptomyces sp. NBC_00006]|uniref:SUKH-4 family immunity protein n=1 Tax=Streptomyces sp. NBC_00006 TaxID=2975619 RepID=UPI00224EF3DC|nr:SUKH-4 family immunity protein [Streptomyces sp. NBC_00006]MCX5530871.1 SUKH-4 family immunity protein [Streptomyces sp. NBC_00006]